MRKALFAIVALSLSVSAGQALAQPTISAETVAQYISRGNDNQRTAVGYYLTISGLTANAEYFAINQVIAISNGDTAATNGAGNVIFVQPTGDFNFTTGPAFTTAANRLTFTATASGTYSGHFINIASGNARFSQDRSDLQYNLRFNDGAGGTTIIDRALAASLVTCIDYGSAANEGTAIYEGANLDLTPGNFVYLYDNVDGTGRPIAIAPIESTSTAQTLTPAFITDNVLGQNGAWGAIIPNTLPNGVRRIEERSRVTGAIVGTRTSADGEWTTTGGPVNTVNPSGGLTALNMSGATGGASSVANWNLLD